MTAPTSAALEYLPGSPCVLERTVLYSGEATARGALIRALTRFGLSPDRIALRKGEDAAYPDQVMIVARDRATGHLSPIGRFLWGLDLAALNAARQELVDDGWQPKPPAELSPDRIGRYL